MNNVNILRILPQCCAFRVFHFPNGIMSFVQVPDFFFFLSHIATFLSIGGVSFLMQTQRLEGTLLQISKSLCFYFLLGALKYNLFGLLSSICL